MSTPRSKSALGTGLVVVSSIALLAAGIALAFYVLIPDSTTTELALVVVGGATATVAGIAGVWLDRIRIVVSVIATLAYLVVGVVLTVGGGATLYDAAQGGFANIGAGMLLLAGLVLVAPATALAVTLAFFVVRDRRRPTLTA